MSAASKSSMVMRICVVAIICVVDCIVYTLIPFLQS